MKINLEFHITNELQHLLEVLNNNNGKSRFVGGMVRDSIINIKNSDIDIATKLVPADIMNILARNKIRYVDTGSKYGTITALIGDDKAEITTLRIDTECDGRHTKAIFTDDFEQDALRRDFTINAMSYCPFEHKLYDYAGGYEDLIAGKVRFIGDAEGRIEEDHLRILRFFRFSDRFAKDLDKESFESCVRLKNLLQKISKERILQELNKIILSPTSYNIFGKMIETKIMAEIMPDAIFEVELLAEMPISITLRYAALLNKTKIDILRKLLIQLKFSNSDIREIINLILFRQQNGDLSFQNLQEIKNIFYPLWVDNIDLKPYINVSRVERNNNFDALNNIIKNHPAIFPVNGDDLIELGFEGKNIGIILDKLKLQWIGSEFSLSKEALFRYASSFHII